VLRFEIPYAGDESEQIHLPFESQCDCQRLDCSCEIEEHENIRRIYGTTNEFNFYQVPPPVKFDIPISLANYDHK
jgi:hypothetical protein